MSKYFQAFMQGSQILLEFKISEEKNSGAIAVDSNISLDPGISRLPVAQHIQIY